MARKTMETRNLPVDLTDEQVESRSRLLARGHLDLMKEEEDAAARAEAAKSAIKAEKERLKRKRGELDALAEAITSRKVKMDVDCDWKYFLGEGEAGVKILVRRDTGQAIERRPVSKDERQLVIGERLEEANEDQLRLWEEQLATAGVPEVQPEPVEDEGGEAEEDEDGAELSE